MKKHLTYLLLLLSVSAQAQSYYDYMDDYNAGGGVDGALNFFIILFFLVIVVLIIGLISVIIYWLSPEYEKDRQKREKAEQERKEKIRIEQERERAYLALPENTIHLIIEGRPHLVELENKQKVFPVVVAICIWSLNRIIWNGTDITNKVGFIDGSISSIYDKYYDFPNRNLVSKYKLVISRCTEFAYELNNASFEVKFTIRGYFEPNKLQIIHHTYTGVKYEGLDTKVTQRDIKCLEFVLYDDNIIQSHFANGEPIAFRYNENDKYTDFFNAIKNTIKLHNKRNSKD